MIYPPAIQAAVAKLGTPYLFGGKWLDPEGNPINSGGGIDCSGLSRWTLSFAPGAQLLPDGAENQIQVCAKLSGVVQGKVPALALGFFDPQARPDLVDHVVTSCGLGVVIEARGAPYNSVILRPELAWDMQHGFLGWYCPPGLTLS